MRREDDGARLGISPKECALQETEYLAPPPQLQAICKRTTELGFAMASEPRTGAMLRALAASKPAGRFLELGTGTGMATAWLLDGIDEDAQLISVDTDAQVQDVARSALGGDPRLTLVTGDGLEFLKSQPSESFDFIFADAMPGKYDGLEEALRVVRRGGFYVIDDLLPQSNWPPGHALKVPALLGTLASRDDLVMATMAWASGLAVAVKRP